MVSGFAAEDGTHPRRQQRGIGCELRSRTGRAPRTVGARIPVTPPTMIPSPMSKPAVATVLCILAAAPLAGQSYEDMPGGPVLVGRFNVCGDPPTTGSEAIRYFDVAEDGVIADLNVGLRIAHSARGDVRLWLRHPDGTLALLLPGVPNDLADNYDILMDDESSNPISDGNSDSTAAPFYDRPVRPATPLSVFDGKSPKGIWLLFACDSYSVDFEGQYLSARLDFTLGGMDPDLGKSSLAFNDPFGRRNRPTSITLHARNLGQTDAAATSLSLPLPANCNFEAGSIAVSSGTASYDAGTRTLHWSGQIASGATETVSFAFRPTVSAGSLAFSATLTDPDAAAPANLSATLNVQDPISGGLTDLAGYEMKDNYHDLGPGYAWREASGGTVVAMPHGDATVSLVAPFPITFHGVASTNLRVANDGVILLNATSGTVGFFNGGLASETRPTIAAFWDDLGDDTGAIYTATFGSAPNREFVVQWNRPHFVNSSLPDSGPGAFQVVFREGSPAILMQYQDVDFSDALYNWGLAATIGATNGSPATTLQYGFNQAVLLNGLAIRIQPAGTRGDGVRWTME
jgi:hypothetical protein